jgi:hypothetical protein
MDNCLTYARQGCLLGDFPTLATSLHGFVRVFGVVMVGVMVIG